MQAIRVYPSSTSSSYSPSNPAPPSALHLDNIPIPKPSQRGDLLVRIKASTVVRDMLTWPETYQHEYAIPGNDFSGIVVETFSEGRFKPGDEVFGMANADRGSTWAEYTILKQSEVALKPKTLTWEEAASLPLSAQTAVEAFQHAGITVDRDVKKKVLITGAAGAVGIYLVQIGAIAGVHVVAATSSNARNEEFLRGLGADEVVEYGDLHARENEFDAIIDTVGGEVLEKCWNYVKDNGAIISVDSASFDFVAEHQKRGLRREGVKALFFIVNGNSQNLQKLANWTDAGKLKPFIVDAFPISQAQQAYEYASGRYSGRGKVIITV